MLLTLIIFVDYVQHGLLYSVYDAIISQLVNVSVVKGIVSLLIKMILNVSAIRCGVDLILHVIVPSNA